MGTYYTPGASRADIIRELLDDVAPYTNSQCETVERQILAHCLRGNVLWTANEVHVDGKLADRWIGCYVLVRRGRTWGYKPMDESMGPHYFTCPVSYLDLAQPEPTDSTAVEWRAKVRAYHSPRSAGLSGGGQ
jgi:hypothetical protein